MEIYKLCIKLHEMEKQIEKNKEALKSMNDSLKQNKTELMENMYSELFSKTCDLIIEFNFYMNQLNDISDYIEIKMY